MLVTIILTRKENEVKSVEAMPKDAQEHKKVQDDAVLTYDISSLMNSASGYTIVIQEYVQQQMINEIKMDGFSMSKNISIGFSPIRTTDSIETVTIRSEQQNVSSKELILKPVPDAPQTLFLYEKVPYHISALSLDTFIPLALYGSFWWDSEYKTCRFCGEQELTEGTDTNEYFKHSPHYYIIGVKFHK
jgi:hypothetical protein